MREKDLTLDIAIATHLPEGITKVADMVLSPIPGIRYVVSWQNHQDAEIPASLKREDVTIHRFDLKGQSANRNNAIAHCTADIILNSDDDLTFHPEGLKDLIRSFESHPEVDAATFKSAHGDMSRFPAESVILKERLPKGYHVAGIEIAFRKDRIGGVRFCEELGFGDHPLQGGEDEIFMYSAIKRGLNCRYFPVLICSHPHESTGFRTGLTEGNLRAQGCVIALMYPGSFIPRLLLKAWRLKKNGQSGFIRALKYLSIGAAIAPGVLRRNHDTMW